MQKAIRNKVLARLLLPINREIVYTAIKRTNELQNQNDLITFAQSLSIHYLKDSVFQRKLVDLNYLHTSNFIDFISIKIGSRAYILSRNLKPISDDTHFEQIVLCVIESNDTVGNVLGGLLLRSEFIDFRAYLNAHAGLFKEWYKSKVNEMYDYCKSHSV